MNYLLQSYGLNNIIVTIINIIIIFIITIIIKKYMIGVLYLLALLPQIRFLPRNCLFSLPLSSVSLSVGQRPSFSSELWWPGQLCSGCTSTHRGDRAGWCCTPYSGQGVIGFRGENWHKKKIRKQAKIQRPPRNSAMLIKAGGQTKLPEF